MKYSVIIPCYKCESTIVKTVSSIQVCGLTDFEIILVDDGSPDGTPALCDRLASEQENIRVFHQPNGGVSSARNRGLSEAYGDYVWFFDSDDLVDPGSMVRAARIIEEQCPDMLIFGMRFEYYTPGGRAFQKHDLVCEEEGMFSCEKLEPLYEELFHCNSLSSVCNKLISRKVLTRDGVHFDESLFIMEDFHYTLMALKCCKTIYLLPEAVYRYIHKPEKAGDTMESASSKTARLEDVAAYIEPFEMLLSERPQLLLGLYFMLLRQKLDTQTPEGIERTAQQFTSGKYASEPFCAVYTPEQRALAVQLREGKSAELYQQMRKARRRRKLKGLIKKTALYCAVKGSKPKRVRF